MTAAEILSEASRAGVLLSVQTGKVLASPPGRLPADLVAEIRAHKPELIAALASPLCTSCQSPLFIESDILCPACYQARRAPGRVLPFDPARRTRTLARLAGYPCPDCQTVAWHVNARGDATCQTCARRRGATTDAGTDGVRGGAA